MDYKILLITSKDTDDQAVLHSDWMKVFTHKDFEADFASYVVYAGKQRIVRSLILVSAKT